MCGFQLSHDQTGANAGSDSHDQYMTTLAIDLQRCARISGVWDDSNNVWEGGGSCITQQEAAQKLLKNPAGLEQMAVQLSNDGGLASFSSIGSPVSAEIMWAPFVILCLLHGGHRSLYRSAHAEGGCCHGLSLWLCITSHC